jgi:hypothetical protein
MDINRLIAELREEHARIQKAILSLERLAGGRGRGRGRPPSWLKEVRDSELNNRTEAAEGGDDADG